MNWTKIKDMIVSILKWCNLGLLLIGAYLLLRNVDDVSKLVDVNQYLTLGLMIIIMSLWIGRLFLLHDITDLENKLEKYEKEVKK